MINEEVARELAYSVEGERTQDWTVVENEQIDSNRWSSIHRLVITDGDGFYEATYSKGLTEYQSESPFEGEKTVDFHPVRKKLILVTEYVPEADTSPQVEVYIPEYISDSDNCWDGRTRYGIHLSLEAALEALGKVFGDAENPLTATQERDYEGNVTTPETWMVHRVSERPSETGSLWIFKERLG